jgi:hypothetical protein
LRTGRSTVGDCEARRTCKYGGRHRRGRGAGPSAVPRWRESAVRKSLCRRSPAQRRWRQEKGTQREVLAAHQAGSDAGCGKCVQMPPEAGADAVEGGQWRVDTGCRRWRKRCVGHVRLRLGERRSQDGHTCGHGGGGAAVRVWQRCGRGVGRPHQCGVSWASARRVGKI